MASRIIRTSISAFLQGYQSFTSIAVLLVFPASASILLCQALIPSSTAFLQIISSRLWSLFQAANFPASSKFFSLLNIKLTQTIYSYFFTLPFMLTFLILAKASIIFIFQDSPRHRLGLPPFLSILPLYRPVLLTHLLNFFIILSANATIFAFLFLVFNAVDILGLFSSKNVLLLSTVGAVLYSIIIANTTVVCNLAIVVAAMDNCSGYLPVLKALVLIRGRVMTALGLALPANLGLAAVEALFQYRVVRQYNLSRKLSSSFLWEAFSITYFHAILLVLEVITSCVFYKSCRTECQSNLENGDHQQRELEPEEKGSVCVRLSKQCYHDSN